MLFFFLSLPPTALLSAGVNGPRARTPGDLSHCRPAETSLNFIFRGPGRWPYF